MSADEAVCRTGEKTAGTEGKQALLFQKKKALGIKNSYR